MKLKVIILILFSIHTLAGPQWVANPKSIEHAEELPLVELLNSQYFKLSPLKQMEVKDLRGFVEFTNESKTIKCSFFKNKIPENVKVELATGSIWENTSGIPRLKENIFEAKNSNDPIHMNVKLFKGQDSIDFQCEFVSKITGQFQSKSDEDLQRASCESRGGIFTHYSRREFDYACDYKLSYKDLKKLLYTSGFEFEARKEPPQIAVVVLGQEPKTSKLKKKNPRQPSSIRKVKPSL